MYPILVVYTVHDECCNVLQSRSEYINRRTLSGHRPSAMQFACLKSSKILRSILVNAYHQPSFVKIGRTVAENPRYGDLAVFTRARPCGPVRTVYMAVHGPYTWSVYDPNTVVYPVPERVYGPCTRLFTACTDPVHGRT